MPITMSDDELGAVFALGAQAARESCRDATAVLEGMDKDQSAAWWLGFFCALTGKVGRTIGNDGARTMLLMALDDFDSDIAERLAVEHAAKQLDPRT